MSIGEKIDTLYTIREERRALDRQSKALKLQEQRLELELINELQDPALSLAQARGTKASFAIRKELVPSVTCWNAVYDYIFDVKDRGLMTKSLLIDPWRTHYEEDNFLIPGTEPFEKTKTSLTKVSR